MAVDLHVGLRPTDVDRFISQFHPLTDPDDSTREEFEKYHGAALGGTSWEQWGESRWEGEDSSEDRPGPEEGEHVVVRGTTRVTALLTLAVLIAEGYDLVPMRFKNQRGIIASITDAEDWAEKVMDVKAGPLYSEGMEGTRGVR